MKIQKCFLAAIGAALVSGHAYALDQIYSPNVEAGEASVEYNGSRTFDKNGAKDASISHEFSTEFSVGDRAVVELAGEFEQEPNEDLKADHFGVETRFQFFEQGENWIDTGLLLAYNLGLQKHSADAVEVKLLLEKDFGKFTSTANLGLEEDMGKYSNADGPEYSFLMNTRYRAFESFEPGVELQSTLGRGDAVSHFDQQEHYIGPSVYGKLFGRVKYEAAYLLGFSDAASTGAGRVKLEYELQL